MKLRFVALRAANDGIHKLQIILKEEDSGKVHQVKFGAKDYSDFTIHRDPDRKRRYILRHKTNEDWTNPLAPGTLSRYILWNRVNIGQSLLDYLDRFGIKRKY